MDRDMGKEDPKYIARGTFGCVLAPPPACEVGHEVKSLPRGHLDVVGKVFHHKKDMLSESVSYARIANKIDPKGEFTVRLYGNCPVPVKAIPGSELDKCKYNLTSLDGSERRNIGLGPRRKHLHQIVYDNGGQPLSAMRGKGVLKEVLIGMRPLFKGLIRMSELRVAHQDIKPANVVFNSGTGRMFLIDFGLSAPLKRIFSKDNMHALDYLYPYFPPEYKYAAALIEGRRLQKRDMVVNFDYFDEVYMQPGRLHPKNHNTLVHVYYNAAIEAALELQGKDLKWLVANAGPKLDVYMLGITLLHQVATVEHLPEADEKKLLGLCWGMIHPMISKRFTPKEALRAYDRAMKEIFGVVLKRRGSPQGINVRDKLGARTVVELRELAKTRGLTGLSKLRKQELVDLLAKHASPSS